MELEWNMFPGFTSLQLINQVHEFMTKMTIHHNSKDELSSFRCSMTSHGDLKKISKNTNQALNSFRFMQKDSHQEDDHSSDLDQKQSDILLTTKDHKENGTKSLNWWWSHSTKANIQSFEPRVHCPEERSKAKEEENYLYTTLPMGMRLKLFFAQLFLLISSVSKEQSQICVTNANPAMLQQGDLFWCDNLTHCLCRQVRWWKHLHLWPMILRKKIHCKSTKNEWTSYHKQNRVIKFCTDAGFLTTVDVGQCFMTEDTEEFLTIYRISDTLYQEMKNHLIRKLGSEWIPKLGPYWKWQPVTYKANM